MQNKPYNPAYDRQFIEYLRYGTSVTEPYYLEDNIPQIYVWRTKGDDKVRTSHKENNGKIFTRDNPPATGHPGLDYNCRCIAEPYVRGVTEYANQTVISDTTESIYKWSNFDFWWYGYYGEGKDLSLAKTGHLNGAINYYFFTLGVMDRINNQIISEARKKVFMPYFTYDFNGSYNFEKY